MSLKSQLRIRRQISFQILRIAWIRPFAGFEIQDHCYWLTQAWKVVAGWIYFQGVSSRRLSEKRTAFCIMFIYERYRIHDMVISKIVLCIWCVLYCIVIVQSLSFCLKKPASGSKSCAATTWNHSRVTPSPVAGSPSNLTFNLSLACAFICLKMKTLSRSAWSRLRRQLVSALAVCHITNAILFRSILILIDYFMLLGQVNLDLDRLLHASRSSSSYFWALNHKYSVTFKRSTGSLMRRTVATITRFLNF